MRCCIRTWFLSGISRNKKEGKSLNSNLSAILRLLIERFFRKNRIFYINGPESLPPPLSREEEGKVFACLNSDPAAKEKLIVHNLRLVVYIARKFESSGIGVEDLISIGTIGLIKAVNTFCPDRNIKLATYASRCIENEILMHLRKTHGLKNEVSIDEPLNIDWDGNELLLSDILGTDSDLVGRDIETQAEKEMILKEVDGISQREKVIMELRFGLRGKREHTQKEVADIIGISQSYISRLEKRIMRQLKEELEKAAVG